MRIRGLVTVAALTVGAAATLGSSTGSSGPVSAVDTRQNPAVETAALASATRLSPVSEPQDAYLPPAGFVAPAPRVARSQRAAPPPPPPAVINPTSPASPTGTGLIAAPVILSSLGIPEIVLNAYRSAELTLMAEAPKCGVPWHLLAGIGRIESGHAGGGRTDSSGTTVTPILGPVLDGRLAGNEVIRDTDRGATDGDAGHDRAVGPMQFIPSTWAKYASDGNADGAADPNNVFDATLAAARYLCSGGLDLRDPLQETRAVLRYNNSGTYAANVITWSNAYRNGGTPTPSQLSDSSTPPPGGLTDAAANGSDLARELAAPPELPPDATPTPTTPPPAPLIPGLPALPALPCVFFCPPADPAAPAPAPAPAEPAAPPPAIAPAVGVR
ncbi:MULTISPECIES: lytic transglycosylase domain-containing protein [Rhodococcus]|uniref:Lytic murein transglycosylase n=1 Tax=Rhodococcus oxybenzonivorans TaxID=1990687 RepID=A0AAE4UZX8_9NOCA|nr:MULTISPECIES: lytic murein transglycosylase [Rhodococcus]MDV7245691.1 lytic murein transglycosylase [Rhodococcus oxybenzonivorans]MDV7265885.1 lytic murein transglycosylase [Rhodococcus oxybenzonivorans]MDV7276954.1 lytic murein transglycosylase [Rhodococcus oxybenzonivorans]MDV7336714.1 lytic murein transglycosylase [Rhodococcus oxybenzonivorans]MDV7346592.1 lytic murein transglycosylase [Rhodococcus oxybenzonivorans]